MLFAPHFVGLDAGWTALTLSVPRLFATIYARQKRSSLDAWVANGRSRFGAPTLLNKQDAGRPTARTMRAGAALYVLPDMDLGARDAVFVPFFGVPDCNGYLPVAVCYDWEMCRGYGGDASDAIWLRGVD